MQWVRDTAKVTVGGSSARSPTSSVCIEKMRTVMGTVAPVAGLGSLASSRYQVG